MGAPGVEAVFLYRRNTVTEGEAATNWTAWGNEPVKTFLSSDFDYDVVHLKKIVHRQVGWPKTAWVIVQSKNASNGNWTAQYIATLSEVILNGVISAI